MKLYFDLDLKSLVSGLGSKSPLKTIPAVRGDRMTMEVGAIRNDALVAFTGSYEMVFVVKEAPGAASPSLADIQGWERVGDFYRADLDLTGEALETLLGVKKSINLLCELTYTDTTGGPNTSQLVAFVLANDLWHGDEPPAEGGDDPEGWLVQRLKGWVPDFGTADSDPNVRDFKRAIQGLTVDYPFYVLSGHQGDGVAEFPVLGISRDGIQLQKLSGVTFTPPAGDHPRDCAWLLIGGVSYLFYTAGSFGGVSYFGVASAADGFAYEHFCDVQGGGAPGFNTWAPEPFLHDGILYVTYSRNTNVGGWNTWFVSIPVESFVAGVFEDWSAPARIPGTGDYVGVAEIDTRIIRYDGAFLMVARNYSGSGNGARLYKSTTSPVAGYTLIASPNPGFPMEGQSLVNGGDGVLRLYGIINPGGAINQQFLESRDGGYTWTSEAVETTGDFEVGHMTVTAFLDPQFAAANSQPLTEGTANPLYVRIDRTSGYYGRRSKVTYSAPAGSGVPLTTSFNVTPATLGIDSIADYQTRKFKVSFTWDRFRTFKEFVIYAQKIGTGFSNGSAPVLHDLNDDLIVISIPNWADNAPIVVQINNKLGYGAAQNVDVMFEEIL